VETEEDTVVVMAVMAAVIEESVAMVGKRPVHRRIRTLEECTELVAAVFQNVEIKYSHDLLARMSELGIRH